MEDELARAVEVIDKAYESVFGGVQENCHLHVVGYSALTDTVLALLLDGDGEEEKEEEEDVKCCDAAECHKLDHLGTAGATRCFAGHGQLPLGLEGFTGGNDGLLQYYAPSLWMQCPAISNGHHTTLQVDIPQFSHRRRVNVVKRAAPDEDGDAIHDNDQPAPKRRKGGTRGFARLDPKKPVHLPPSGGSRKPAYSRTQDARILDLIHMRERTGSTFKSTVAWEAGKRSQGAIQITKQEDVADRTKKEGIGETKGGRRRKAAERSKALHLVKKTSTPKKAPAKKSASKEASKKTADSAEGKEDGGGSDDSLLDTCFGEGADAAPEAEPAPAPAPPATSRAKKGSSKAGKGKGKADTAKADAPPLAASLNEATMPLVEVLSNDAMGMSQAKAIGDLTPKQANGLALVFFRHKAFQPTYRVIFRQLFKDNTWVMTIKALEALNAKHEGAAVQLLEARSKADVNTELLHHLVLICRKTPEVQKGVQHVLREVMEASKSRTADEAQ